MSRSLKKIRTLTSLSKEERKVFFSAAFLLIRIRFLMIYTPFSKILKKIKHWSPSTGTIKHLQAERICWMIDSAGYTFPWLFSCLTRALSGFVVCRKNGWDVRLCIGARRPGGRAPFEAHAWLEWEGKIIIGQMPEMDKYAVFDSFQGQFLS